MDYVPRMTAVSVEARVERVTVYASGARVRRVTTIPAPLPGRVRIVGLPLAVIDDTVRVEVGGPAIATGVRVGVDAPDADSAAAEDGPEVLAARRRSAHAEAEVERVTAALQTVGEASAVHADPSDEAPAAFDAVLAARRALVAVKAERELALREELAAARRAADDARKALEAVLDRDRRFGSARAPRLHELRKHVELELQATAASEIVIHLEYQVAAARWAPSYVARLEGDRVTLEIRAVVAQATGEDWTSVPLALSTAEPDRFSLLPELAPQKIGRRQQEPARAGFRAPPVGADALYADFDRERAPVRPAAPPPTPEPMPASTTMLAAEVWDEQSSRGKEAFATPPGGFQMQELGRGLPPPAPPPPQAARRPTGMVLDVRKKAAPARLESNGAARGGGGAMPKGQGAPASEVPRLDYGNLVMAPPSSPVRGTLQPAPPGRHASAIASEVTSAAAKLAGLPLPTGFHATWTHVYDYAYATEGAVDVRADGAWHSIPVTAKPGSAKLRHVAVPRAQAAVFRVAELGNPFPGPLLPGPVDVYDHGRYLVTSEVDFTPPGTTIEIGLGVDPQLKIARNTEYREEATGMLRGGLRLHHAISIDVENLSPRAAKLEVRERVPVTREGDDDVEVVVSRVEPAWERWSPDAGAPREQRLRGAFRWKLEIPAGAKQTLRAAYEVRIAGKNELVGGNRREP